MIFVGNQGRRGLSKGPWINTANLAAAMTEFNPDNSWERVD